MDPDELQRVRSLLATSKSAWAVETYGTGEVGDANLADLGAAERDAAHALLSERALLQWAPPREISWPRVLSGECLANRLFARRALINKAALARALRCWRPTASTAADEGSDVNDVSHPCPETHCVEGAEDVEALRAKRGGAWVVKPAASSNANNIVFLSEGDALPPHLFADGNSGQGDESSGRLDPADPASARGRETVGEWVMQRHIDMPLLTPDGRKFHVRAFLLVSGRLRAYLHDDCFALVASRAYVPLAPSENEDGLPRPRQQQQHDPFVHLTNRSVAVSDPTRRIGSDRGGGDGGDDDDCLRPLASVLPGDGACAIEPVLARMRAAAGAVVAGMQREGFKAFCPLQTTFEIFGLDFLIASAPAGRVYLLEANACPRLFLSRTTVEDALPLLPEPLGDGGVVGSGCADLPGPGRAARCGGWQQVFP